MAGAIRMVSLARGHDPRDFALFAFGGAGPLHAAALARELAIPRVLIPARPGLTNALGCTVADVRHDYVRTVNLPLAERRRQRGWREYSTAQIEARARAHRAAKGVAVGARSRPLHRADMQFQGQSHILTGGARRRASMTPVNCARLFEAAYFAALPASSCPEIRAGAGEPAIPRSSAGASRSTLHSIDRGEPRGARWRRRGAGAAQVWFDGGWMDTPVYRREWLPAGCALSTGPAIIEQLDTTTVIEPGDRADARCHRQPASSTV